MISRKFIVGLSVVFLLSLVGAFIYSGALRSPFVFDDEPNITNNHALQITSCSVSELQRVVTDSPLRSRPVAYLSFAMNYLVHGYDLTGYHLVNILIHILTSILLYCFLSMTFQLAYGSDRSKYVLVSLAAALLWLVHPVQVQSVTYIVQRMNSMSVMFYLLSMVLYIKARQTPGRLLSVFLFAGVLISGLLAMGSKEIAVTLPVFLYGYELYFLQKKMVNFYRQMLICLLLVLLTVAVAYYFLGPHPLDRVLQGYAARPFTLEQRLLTESRIVFFYLSLLLYPDPSRLNLQHDFPLSTSLVAPWTTLLSIAGLVCLIILACFLFRRHRFISFSILWFLGNLVLESSVIPLELVFEHRLYLPSMAFCWLVSLFLIKLFSRQWFGVVVMGSICLLFASWSWQRNNTWATPLDFARDCAEKSPGLARAHGTYGEALYQAGYLREAVREFQQTLHLQPDYPEAHNGLGLVYSSQGLKEAAETEYKKALTLNPNYMRAYNNIGVLYLGMNEPHLAISHLERAVQLRPDYIQAWYNLALAHEAIGEASNAELCYLQALQFGPVSRVNFALGVLLYEQGRCTKAKKEFEIVQQLLPTDMETQRYISLAEMCRQNDKPK